MEAYLWVVTRQLESGRQVSRLLHRTKSIEDALRTSLDIYGRNGALSCDELLYGSVDIWQFGWRSELTDLREQVRNLAPRHVQPLWSEF